MASEPAEPTTRPQDELIEKLLAAVIAADTAEYQPEGEDSDENWWRYIITKAVMPTLESEWLADPAQTTELEQVVAQSVRLLREAGVNRGDGLPARVSTLISERDALEKILSKERRRVDTALQLIHVFTATGPHFLSPDETREVAAALVGDQPPAEEPKPPPPPFRAAVGHWVFRGYDQLRQPVWSWSTEDAPLSGEALRDVEERDDAAGDLP